MDELLEEIRQEYHIPPFFSYDALKSPVDEGKYRLEKLNPGFDLKKDLMGRHLLKTYVYYAYHNKTDTWVKNYSSTIIEWQMGSEI